MSAFTNPITSPQPEQKPPQLVPHEVVPPPRRPYKLIAAIVFGLLLAIAGYLALRTPPAQQTAAAVVTPTVKAEIGNVQQTIRVAGQTATRQFANITAPMIRGPEGNRPMVLLKLAPSGSIVKKGTLLASIDGQGIQDHVEDLKDTIEAAEADVRKREAELQLDNENMRQNILAAKAEMDKAKLEAGAAEVRTDVERQLLELAADETSARYKQLLLDVDNKKKSDSGSLGILKITLERHKRHIGRHMVDLERFTILSPIDGLLVYSSVWGGSSMRQIELGDQVAPGQPFMKVVNTSTMTVEAKINQAESEMFRIGQPARVTLDAFASKSFPASVYSITPIAVGSWRQNYFIRNVPIRIAITGSDPQLIPDLSAAADVVLNKQEGKVVIPLAAVKLEDGKGVVAVKTATGFENRSVELGLRSNTHAAILSGLKAGEEVRASF